MLFDCSAHIKYLSLSKILKDFKFGTRSKFIKDLIQDFEHKGIQYSLPTHRALTTHRSESSDMCNPPTTRHHFSPSTWSAFAYSLIELELKKL